MMITRVFSKKNRSLLAELVRTDFKLRYQGSVLGYAWSLLRPLLLFLLEISLFALGLSLFLAAAFVKYRDVNYIWEVILQAGFYLTPILYPITLITSPALQKLMLLNPMAQAIQDARYASITHQTAISRQ